MLVPMYVHFAGGSPRRGLTRRLRRGWWGCRPRGEKSFLSKRKKGPKKARGTATPEAARPAARYSQISAFRALPCPALVICSGLPVANCLRQLCPLGTRSLSAQASVCGSRTVGRPEFIRVVQFRPKGRNSLTTFRGQTALRGCPRPRLAALTRREKALYCPFLKEGVRNVARNRVGQLSPALGARSCSPFSAVKMGGPFSLRCLSPLCSPAAGVGQTQTAVLGMLRCG